MTAAGDLAGRHELGLESETVERVLDRAAPALSSEPRTAVLHATTADDLAQIVGRAGAGKTTAARAISAAYEEAGYEVRGAALAGKAAQVLETETGVRSRTLASVEHAWSEGTERARHSLGARRRSRHGQRVAARPPRARARGVRPSCRARAAPRPRSRR